MAVGADVREGLEPTRERDDAIEGEGEARVTGRAALRAIPNTHADTSAAGASPARISRHVPGPHQPPRPQPAPAATSPTRTGRQLSRACSLLSASLSRRSSRASCVRCSSSSSRAVASSLASESRPSSRASRASCARGEGARGSRAPLPTAASVVPPQLQRRRLVLLVLTDVVVGLRRHPALGLPALQRQLLVLGGDEILVLVEAAPLAFRFVVEDALADREPRRLVPITKWAK
eukprot:5760169-Prymnesium_polylepis.1